MPRKRANRRKHAPRAQRTFRLPTINWVWLRDGVIIAGLAAMIWSGTAWLLERPIQSVRVEGAFERVTVMQVEAAMAPYLDNGFLTLDIDGLRAAITDLPWVQDAIVVRRWPSTVSVTLTEEEAAARWGDAGLLNVYGDLFVEDATHIPAELPALSGPEGTQLQVAERFFDLDVRLKQRGMHARALALDERGAWLLTLNNGVQVRLGAEQIDMRTARFFEALDRVLVPVTEQIDYVDMRYTNGFAVGWKPTARMRLADSRESNPNG